MSKKGVFICKGCGIGESIDCDQLVKVAGEKAAPAVIHDCLCSADGLEVIKKGIADEIGRAHV